MRSLAAIVVLAGCVAEPAPIVVTRHFVIADLGLPSIGMDARAPGFDLDGRVSDGTGLACTDEEDFTSPVTGHAGVDNQLAANLQPTGPEPMEDGFRELYLQSVAEGRTVLLLEVSSTSVVEDASAEVRLLLASSSGGEPCDNADLVCSAGSICPLAATAAMPARCGPRTGSATPPDRVGVVLPDQSFVPIEVIATAPATIRAGRLATELDRFVFPTRVSGVETMLPIRDVRVEGTITDEAVRDAELGGGIRVADIVALAAALGVTGIDEATVRAVAAPDLDPDASGECRSISAGMLLSAVRAHVAP